MRTLPEKYLSEIPLEEATYQVDFQVLDRYQAFSAELLRLALLGLTGYGFLLVNVVLASRPSPGDSSVATPLADGVVFFVSGAFALTLAAACALGHRYFSTDCMAHHVRRLRLRKRIGERRAATTEAVVDVEEVHKRTSLIETDSPASLEDTIRHEAESLRTDLSKCKWLLIASSGFLVMGTLAVAGAFAAVLL